MRRIGYRHQRTLAQATEVRGIGFVTGARVRLRFSPAPVDTGIVFIRTDLPGRPTTAARSDRVTGTNRRTTLGHAESGVTLVEHVLSALSGLRIDNCAIELDAVEPPGLDGSAYGFVEALTSAGTALQSARRPVYMATETVVVNHAGATISLHPSDTYELTASYMMDYGPGAIIPRQSYTLAVNPDSFIRELAGCRTFLLEREADVLRAQGIGRHLTASEVLVFGQKGPIDNAVRYADEPARHKVLDLLGDLALCGFDIVGHVVAYRSGHALNVALANALSNKVRISTTEVVVPTRVTLPPRRRAA